MFTGTALGGASGCDGSASRAPAAPEAARASTLTVQAVHPVPLRFEPNLGQAPDGVAALARGGDLGVRLRPEGIGVALPAEPRTLEARLRRIAEGRPAVARPPVEFSVAPAEAGALEWVLEDPAPGVVHHLAGPEAAWVRGVPTYRRARAAVAPGVELVVRAEGGRLRYDYEVAAGVDPAALSWRFEAADRVALAPSGALALTVAGRELLQLPPRVFQRVEGRAVERPAAYHLDGREARLQVDAIDPRRPLLVDPVLVRADPGPLDAPAVALGDDGSFFLTGQGEPDPGTGHPIAVMRLDPAGEPLWSVALPAEILDVAVLGDRVAVTGTTSSPDYPVVNAWQPALNDTAEYHPPADAVLTVFDAESGEIVFSTYFGSAALTAQEAEAYNIDAGDAVAFAPTGAVVIAGHTDNGGDFPVTDGAVGLGLRRGAFLARFSAEGDLELSLAYGGQPCGSWGASVYDGYTGVASVAATAEADLVWTGGTNAMHHPTVAPVQAEHSGAEYCHPGGLSLDGWLGRAGPAGDAWRYAGYLGDGPCTNDGWTDLSVDDGGGVRLVGWHGRVGAPDDALPPQCDVTRLYQPGSLAEAPPLVARIAGVRGDGTLAFHRTVFEGAGFNAVAALPDGDLLVGGVADADGLDLPEAFQPARAGGRDGLVAVVSPDGTVVRSGSYLGGSAEDVVYDVAAGTGGRVVVVGRTASDDFPFSEPPATGAVRGTPFVAVLALETGGDDQDAGTDDTDAGTDDTDAGTHDGDAGTDDGDAGTGDSDAGPDDGDAGTDDADAGTDDADAGSEDAEGGSAAPTPDTRDDGGCAAPGAGGSSLLALLLLGLAARRGPRGRPAHPPPASAS